MSGTEGRVLVGIDDSEGAAVALDYAFDEAVRRGWSLRVVLA
jgi:nucleotide-binding universal stress UspA family protein